MLLRTALMIVLSFFSNSDFDLNLTRRDKVTLGRGGTTDTYIRLSQYEYTGNEGVVAWVVTGTYPLKRN